MSAFKRFLKYRGQYKVSKMLTMIKNNKLDSAICTDSCKGKLVVITGATSGIGRYTAFKYASMGARLICINRHPEKSQVLCDELKATYGIDCSYMIADFSSMKDVHKLADQLHEITEPIDILIHNAGIYLTKKHITADNLEMVFAVNFVSSFLLNYLLKDKFKKQNKGRIILVNSEGHRFAPWGLRMDDLDWSKRMYSGLGSYGSSKTAQILSMIPLNDYFKDSGVVVNAMHPGAVKTDSGKDNGAFYKWYKQNIIERNFKTPEISAEALYYMGVSPELDGMKGKFFNLTTMEEPAPPTLDEEAAWRLWDHMVELIKSF